MSGHIGDMVSQHYNTPKALLESVRRVLSGPIDLDPCDNEWSTTAARVSYTLPAHDGLKDSWLVAPDGSNIGNVFCNPPYGVCYVKDGHEVISRDEYKALKERGLDGNVELTSIADWVARCASYGRNIPVFALIPSSTETEFWHEYIWNFDMENVAKMEAPRWAPADAICFIRGRIRHPLMGKETAPSTKGSAMIFWGDDPFVKKFEEEFRKHGRVTIL